MKLDLSAEALAQTLRNAHAETKSPTFYSRSMLDAAKRSGLNVDALLAEGVIAEDKPVPTGGPVFISKWDDVTIGKIGVRQPR